MVQTCGSLLVLTMLFQVSGDSLSVRSSSECSVEGTFASMGNIIASSLFNKVVALWPVTFIASLHSLNFIFIPSQEEVARQRQSLTWRRRSVMFWTSGVVYIVVAVFVVSVFLASVRPLTASAWMWAALMTLLMEALLIPVVVAVGMTTLAMTCASCLDRDRVQQCGAHARISRFSVVLPSEQAAPERELLPTLISMDSGRCDGKATKWCQPSKDKALPGAVEFVEDA